MDLNYTISTKAELAGAEAAAEALERQISKAKALKQDYSELSRQHDLMTESIKAAHIPHDREIADTEQLKLGKRELLESMRGVTREFPVLGEAARSVFNPITAIVGSLTIMLVGVFEALKKVEDMRLPDLTEGIDQAEQLGDKWAGIGQSVAEADDAFNSFSEVHARALTAISAELKATQDLITATKERALAELNVQRAGGMDQGEYERKKNIIERGADDASAQAEIDARNKKLAADKAEADKAAADAAAKAKAAADAKGAPNKETAEAEIAAQKEVEKRERDKQKTAAGRVEQIQDVDTDIASAKGVGGWILAAIENIREIYRASTSDNSSGTKAFTMSGDAANEASEKKASADAKARADAAAAEAARIKKDADNKEKLEKEADEAAKKARELQDKLGPESVAVAQANANQAARQADKDKTGTINADASAFGADTKRINQDINTIGRENGRIDPESVAKAKAAHDDLVAAFTDAMSVVSELATMGEDTKKMKAELAKLQQRVAQVSTAADTH